MDMPGDLGRIGPLESYRLKCEGGENVAAGVNWLRTELPDFWNLRTRMIELLDYLARLPMARSMAHWECDGRAAELLAGAQRAAHV
jgi:hypothetical protein